MHCDGHAGLVAYQAPPIGRRRQRESPLWRTHLVVRAVALAGRGAPRYAVIVDVPVTAATGLQIENETGIELGDISTLGMTATDVVPVIGRAIEEDSPCARGEPPGRLGQPLTWMTFLDYSDWVTGREGNVVIAIGLERHRSSTSGSPRRRSRRSATTASASCSSSCCWSSAALFLVIQTVAFVMGLSLARSITGAVHELATGTEHVRRGDFTHRIIVDSHDQLGDLAESFNSMTASVEDLLQQKAEKERMEQELRIARQIQMSLLPQGPLDAGEDCR